MANIYNKRHTLALYQMFKYFWVAFVASIVDYIAFILSVELGVNMYIANVLAFILGLAVNYALAIKFVFKGKSTKTFDEFVIFALIGFVGLNISNFTLYYTVNLLEISVGFAKILAILTTFLWNFSARKFLLFSEKSKK